MSKMIGRRTVLRGFLGGAAVSIALPLLDCFLNENGTAMAAGTPMPLRFGTWFWGLGMNNDIFIPKKVGADYDTPEEMAAIESVKQHINVFTKFNVFKDDYPNLCHFSGWVGLRSGAVPASRADLPGESIDATVAKKIGGYTRFRSLDATATANPRDSMSYLGANTYNTPEISPLAMYQRIFGADFQDPNGKTFTPNPRVMVRRSVLSAVLDQTKTLENKVSAEDRARLDQYFTDMRSVERQLESQLTKPEPRDACRVMAAPPDEMPSGLDYQLVAERHRLLTDLMVMAVACDQTRVFNMVYSASVAGTTKPGAEMPHHTSTHEELVDPKLGYQPTPSFFTREAIKCWAYFVQALASVKEGGGTLLDNTLIYAHSDQELARIHSLSGIPMFTAGKFGGKFKTGLHVQGGDSPGTRLGYTIQKGLGIDVPSWGAKSNQTSQVIGEIVA